MNKPCVQKNRHKQLNISYIYRKMASENKKNERSCIFVRENGNFEQLKIAGILQLMPMFSEECSTLLY